MSSSSLASLNVVMSGPGTPDSVLVHFASFLVRQHREQAVFALATHPLPAAWSLIRQTQFTLIVEDNTPQRQTVRRGRGSILLGSVADILLTAKFILGIRRRFDLYIGAGQHLILLGLLLRRLGIVKKVVAFSMDYWPQKYRTRLLNSLYLALDSFCVVKADWVFNASPTMFNARLQRGVKLDSARQITVPHPVEANEIGSVSRDQLEPDSLIFAGLASDEYGFELLIEAITLVARQRPSAIVTVTGYGEFPTHHRDMIIQRGLQKNFRLAGYVEDRAAFRDMLRRKRIGLAPYRPLNTSCKRFTDVSRPKVYMANGVPPIITRVPPIASEIEASGAGLVIDYDRDQLAKAILRLFADEAFHERCRRRGFVLVRRYDADAICRNAISAMGVTATNFH